MNTFCKYKDWAVASPPNASHFYEALETDAPYTASVYPGLYYHDFLSVYDQAPFPGNSF
jgi:hypothetical protein